MQEYLIRIYEKANLRQRKLFSNKWKTEEDSVNNICDLSVFHLNCNKGKDDLI